MMNKRRTGGTYERIAGEWLERNGYTVLEYNVYTRQGEIDIVATQGDTLCFIEVKYRSSLRFGDPSEAVTLRKQESICRAALCYCNQHGRSGTSNIRFDIVGICGASIRLIKDAFPFRTPFHRRGLIS